jgi:hypothetical protein
MLPMGSRFMNSAPKFDPITGQISFESVESKPIFSGAEEIIELSDDES